MVEEIATFLWGDSIRLGLEFEHEANLTRGWSEFYQQDPPAEVPPDEFEVRLRNLDDMQNVQWLEAKRISRVFLEAAVDRGNQRPGLYELVSVWAEIRKPSGDSTHDGDLVEFEIPESVRLRIADPPAASNPKVTD